MYNGEKNCFSQDKKQPLDLKGAVMTSWPATTE